MLDVPNAARKGDPLRKDACENPFESFDLKWHKRYSPRRNAEMGGTNDVALFGDNRRRGLFSRACSGPNLTWVHADGPRTAFGRDAIAKDFVDAFKKGFSNLQATVATREITGDVAWAGGDWSAMGPGPNNKMQSIHGHWSNFYVREDGGWKIRVAVNMGTGRGF